MFSLLHPSVRRWVWDQGWQELRQAQAAAVAPILAQNTDVIISAATASGKTEAAFMPICTTIANQPALTPGVEVLYVAPLKALINDQFLRLEGLAENIGMSVHKWHGDVSGSHKSEVLRKPTGALLITPESLEAMFVLRGPQLPSLFAALRYIVIDELHSFIGTERGAQLQSLLHRIEGVTNRFIPRIALSATLGDMSSAASFLRPFKGGSVKLIIDDQDSQALKMKIRGYRDVNPQDDPSTTPPATRIAQDIFDTLRGTDNLIFTNTRTAVEIYADLLAELSTQAHIPKQFFAHHGSLSKDLREHVESGLKDTAQPVNAVCTSTLEMGIDIGDVESIAQVGAPPSVASLRQRLGRSGRRGGPAILRGYVSALQVLSSTPPPDALHTELVQTIAMINLLLDRWYEPPDPTQLHLSTLIQQILSVVAQHGGATASKIFQSLLPNTAFANVDTSQFIEILKALGAADVLVQSPDGTLLLGQAGERIVNHFSFYAAFATPEEYRLSHAGQTLGTLPIDYPLFLGSFVIFGGRRWRVINHDSEHKVVDLTPAPAGRPPKFTGSGASIHEVVRKEMRRVYNSSDTPAYLDRCATSLLIEARQNFDRYQLGSSMLLASGENTYIFPWTSDRAMHTMAVLLTAQGLEVTKEDIALQVAKLHPYELAAELIVILAGDMPDPAVLASGITNKIVEKYDHLLTPGLLNVAYASRNLDVPGAWDTLNEVANSAVA